MAGLQDSNIRITGVKGTITALREFAPEIEAVLDAEIRAALEATQRAAQSRYPGGSWIVGRNRKKLLGYVAARAGGRRAQRFGDSAPGIRAAIFEFAGAQQPGRTPQAAGMIASLNSRYGGTGRFLWGAWDSTGKSVLAGIASAVRLSEKALQAKLDSLGEEY